MTEQDRGVWTGTLESGGLLAASKGKDATAEFAALVREHQAMVFSLANRFLRNRALAEEIAQEAFLRLYQNLPSIESPLHLLRWLRTVTWRLCVDEVRRRPPHPGVSLDEIAEPPAASAGEDALLSERIREMVAGLPDSVRMAVILRYQEDMDPSEIAEVLGVPLNTVKSKLHRALLMLRGKWSRSRAGRES
jgi:RNA polymerase sigma-70 factor, ECF subfamily